EALAADAGGARPSRPAVAASDRRRAGPARAAADAARDDRVELRAAGRHGARAVQPARRVRRRLPPRSRRSGLRPERRARARPARWARVPRREEPPASEGGPGRRATILDARDDSRVRGREAGRSRLARGRTSPPRRPPPI